LGNATDTPFALAPFFEEKKTCFGGKKTREKKRGKKNRVQEVWTDFSAAPLSLEA
jgi:hypothetical protein